MENKKWTDVDLRIAFEDGCKFLHFKDLQDFLLECRQNAENEHSNCNIPVMPSTFIREWKCAKTNPPADCDRYWCLVKEQNDLGISYYQWNCSYNVGIGFTKPHHNDIEITHWTELLPRPF